MFLLSSQLPCNRIHTYIPFSPCLPFLQLWEVYNERRVLRTFNGHKQAVREASFNNTGEQFLSAAYDRYIKLWDTETGICLN